MTKYRWKKVSLVEVFDHAKGKTFRESIGNDFVTGGRLSGMNYPKSYRGKVDLILFGDGSLVATASDWEGPLSEVTPDIDAKSPEFFIGKPVKGKK